MLCRFACLLNAASFIMCEPVTIAAVTIGAFSQYQGAKAEKQAARFNAAVSRNNAIIDDQRASDAVRRGGDKVFARRLQQSQTVGAQRARLAARGLSLDSGSALNILLDTDFIADLDVNTIRNNADRESWALRQSAGAHRSQSELLKSQADSISPGLSLATSLLTGASQFGGFGG